MKLPKQFKFQLQGDIYAAEILDDDYYFISWKTADGADGTTYPTSAVGEFVEYGDWKIIEEQNFLSRIKAFTEDTGASVFIADGTYEVHYNGGDCCAKASTDEEMQKIMDALVLLQEASSGE